MLTTRDTMIGNSHTKEQSRGQNKENTHQANTKCTGTKDTKKESNQTDGKSLYDMNMKY